jgi:hypothetical protein
MYTQEGLPAPKKEALQRKKNNNYNNDMAGKRADLLLGEIRRKEYGELHMERSPGETAGDFGGHH